LIEHAFGVLDGHLDRLTLEEALFAGAGHRSVLGILKHIGGWLMVYHSYAFADEPLHWEATSWPRSMRDTVEPSRAYLDEVVAWVHEGQRQWTASLDGAEADDTDQVRPVHWGAELPLGEIVVLVATHVVYHAGEINLLLSVIRGEAWEHGEEVEENHISTVGHRVRPPWMTDEQFADYLAAHPG
jgi:uncharacterized damage-inducible protein DinB